MVDRADEVLVVVDPEPPVGAAGVTGVVGRVWARGTWRCEVHGRVVEPGAPMDGRADPVLTWAMTALAAAKQARLAGARATTTHIDVEPGRVVARLDLRAATDEALAALVAGIERQGGDRADRDGTTLVVVAEEVAAARDADLPVPLADLAAEHGWPTRSAPLDLTDGQAAVLVARPADVPAVIALLGAVGLEAGVPPGAPPDGRP